MKARRAWDRLNERQRTYMRVLYREDQAAEREHRLAWFRGRFDRRPARAWRRIAFNAAGSPIPSALSAAGVYDQGAGSTLAALADRGLIETTSVPALIGEVVLVWVTRAGRAAVRSGLAANPEAVEESHAD